MASFQLQRPKPPNTHVASLPDPEWAVVRLRLRRPRNHDEAVGDLRSVSRRLLGRARPELGGFLRQQALTLLEGPKAPPLRNRPCARVLIHDALYVAATLTMLSASHVGGHVFDPACEISSIFFMAARDDEDDHR